MERAVEEGGGGVDVEAAVVAVGVEGGGRAEQEDLARARIEGDGGAASAGEERVGAQLEAGVDRERQVRPDVAIGALQRGAAGLADVLRRRELPPAGEQVVGRALHSGEALGGVAEADDVRRRGLVGVDAAAGAVRVRVGERPAGAVEQRSAEEVVRGVVGADVVPLHVGDEAPVREPEQLPARLVGEGRGGGGAEEQREEHQPDAVADAVGGEVEAGAQDERDGGGAEGPAQEREDGQHARRREEVRERFEHGGRPSSAGCRG